MLLGISLSLPFIREAHGIVAELSKLTKLGPIAVSIAKSGRYLSIIITLMVLFSLGLLGSFALIVL